jgi:hypothetical protein
MLKHCFLRRGMKLISFDPCWLWYYSKADECLYQLYEHGWQQFSTIVKESNCLLFQSQRVHVDTTPKLYRATVHHKRDRWVCSSFGDILPLPSHDIPSFQDQLLLSSFKEKWFIANVDSLDDGNIKAENIRNRVAIAVSNGSFKEINRTAAWVLERETSA